MDNLKLIDTSSIYPYSEYIATAPVEMKATYYEVANPHWIAALNERGEEGLSALEKYAQDFLPHDFVHNIAIEDGKYILEAIDR